MRVLGSCGSLELGAEELDFLLGFGESGDGLLVGILLADIGFHDFEVPGFVSFVRS